MHKPGPLVSRTSGPTSWPPRLWERALQRSRDCAAPFCRIPGHTYT